MARLCADVFTADKSDTHNGLKVLGTPFGKQEYVDRIAAERTEEKGHMLRQLPNMPDLQCAWVMLAISAVPRANHMVRMLPPSQVRGYAERHDAAIWQTFCQLFEAGHLTEDALGCGG